MINKYEFMREEWGTEGNPFPASGIYNEGDPFNPKVFPRECTEFFEKLIGGAILDRRAFNFLWSKSRTGEDTGFSKTAILRYGASQVNEDFGLTVLRDCGLSESQANKHQCVVAYACMDTANVVGVYPAVFSAVEYMADPSKRADGVSLFRMMRDKIIEINGLEDDDESGVELAVEKARKQLGRTLPQLKADLIAAFASSDEHALSEKLSEVSPATRIRSGLAYLDFAVTAAAAAGIPHLFIFIDQLEDLATVPTVTKAKRTREVGRFRDIAAEMNPYVGRVHFVFTFHVRAADALNEMWVSNRLPSYDPEDPATEESIVVLRGIEKVEQVKTLVNTYLNMKRETQGTSAAPFHEDALKLILERSAGRTGVILRDAHNLYGKAAAENVKTIDRKFVERILGNRNTAGLQQRKATSGTRAGDAHAISDMLS